MKNIIRFVPLDQKTYDIKPSPRPATGFVPEWYKNFPHRHEHPAKVPENPKACAPFTDSLTSGYMVLLSGAVACFNNEDGSKYIDWKTSWDVVDTQSLETYFGYPIPEGYHPQIFRWLNPWAIKTPDGYSISISHPHHRFDLPFLTMSAVVDTDRLPNTIVFPFLIKKDFEGIIPEGTPIAQIMPFKREEWDSEKSDFDESISNGIDIMKQGYIRAYKNKFWNKKSYR